MDEGLKQQVIADVPNPELVAMKKRIGMLQGLYFVLFIASLILLVWNWQSHAAQSMHVLWALTLGGAVVTRLIRQSLVNKYNAALMGGRPAPLT